jgi:hypothetical protein
MLRIMMPSWIGHSEAPLTMRQLTIGSPGSLVVGNSARRNVAPARRFAGPIPLLVSLVCAIAFAGSATAGAGDPRIPAHARIGNTTLADAKFEFACRDGKGGTLSINLVLPPRESDGLFPFDKFEGPDGIGEMHDLAEWSVSGAAKPARARTHISGWYGVDGDGFLFSAARESGHPSDLARLAKRLVSSDQARLRLVVKPPGHGNVLKVEAPIAGHREVIEKALAPCLAPVK